MGLTNTLRMEVIMKQITKKLLISSLSLGMIVLCCTGAFAREYIDEPCSETVSYVQSIEQQAWAISLMDGCNLNNTRATNRLDITIGAGKLLKADTPFSLEVGETVSMNFTYSPRNSSISAGLIDSNGYFYSFAENSGTINKTIRVNKTGKYYLAFRNNSNTSVQIMGFVYY